MSRLVLRRTAPWRPSPSSSRCRVSPLTPLRCWRLRAAVPSWPRGSPSSWQAGGRLDLGLQGLFSISLLLSLLYFLPSPLTLAAGIHVIIPTASSPHIRCWDSIALFSARPAPIHRLCSSHLLPAYFPLPPAPPAGTWPAWQLHLEADSSPSPSCLLCPSRRDLARLQVEAAASGGKRGWQSSLADCRA